MAPHKTLAERVTEDSDPTLAIDTRDEDHCINLGVTRYPDLSIKCAKEFTCAELDRLGHIA